MSDMPDAQAILGILDLKANYYSARRWARAWKKMAKNERSAGDMVAATLRVSTIEMRVRRERIAELEEALRIAWRRSEQRTSRISDREAPTCGA